MSDMSDPCPKCQAKNTHLQWAVGAIIYAAAIGLSVVGVLVILELLCRL